MSTPDTRRKNRRQKATTQLGRAIMQEQRQKLAAEQAELAAKMVREADANRNAQRPVNMPPREHVALNRSVVRRVGAVLASENVVVPIRCERGAANQQMRAWTDFEKIYVRYAQQNDRRVLAATIRGLLYHEGGHCRWTVPFTELAEMAHQVPERHLHKAWNCLEDQRMETAVVSDSPRKAAYLTPMVMTTHMATIDIMVANYPLLIWRKYIPARLRAEARRLFVFRHGPDGEALAQAMEDVVTRYVMATDATTMWGAVLAFHLLLGQCNPLASLMDDHEAGHSEQERRPKRLKEASKDFDGLTIPIAPDMLPQGAGEDEDAPEAPEPRDLNDLNEQEVLHIMEVLAASYLSAETLIAMRFVVMGGEPEPGEGAGSNDEQDEEDPADWQPSGPSDEQQDDGSDDAADGEQPEQDDQRDGQHGGDKEEEEAAADDGDGAGNKQSEKVDPAAGSRGTHTDDGSDAKDKPLTQNDLDEAIEEAEAERDGQSEVADDLRAWDDAESDSTSDLDVYTGGVAEDATAIAEADALAYEIEQAFHEHTMDRAPSWVEEQRRGVLNVQRYMTRQAGDVEFFRQYIEDEAPGYNIAVTVALDYSGSMQRHATRLA